MWVRIPVWPVATLGVLEQYRKSFVLWMGREAVGPVYYIIKLTHVKEPRTLIVEE